LRNVTLDWGYLKPDSDSLFGNELLVENESITLPSIGAGELAEVSGVGSVNGVVLSNSTENETWVAVPPDGRLVVVGSAYLSAVVALPYETLTETVDRSQGGVVANQFFFPGESIKSLQGASIRPIASLDGTDVFVGDFGEVSLASLSFSSAGPLVFGYIVVVLFLVSALVAGVTTIPVRVSRKLRGYFASI